MLVARHAPMVAAERSAGAGSKRGPVVLVRAERLEHRRWATERGRPLEGAGRVRGPEPHREVDVGGGRDTVAERPVGLVDDGQRDALHDPVEWEIRAEGPAARELLRRADRAPVRAVVVEAGARLAPEAARRDQPFLDRRRPEPLGKRIARGPAAFEDPARRRERDVDPGQVHQLEWAHREPRAAHGAIDGVDGHAA